MIRLLIFLLLLPGVAYAAPAGNLGGPAAGASSGGGGGSGCVPSGSTSGLLLTDNGAGGCANNTTGAGVLAALGQPIGGTTGLVIGGANSNITSLSGLTTPLSVAQGGTGTATPGLVQGTNITITGTWPNQTINASGGGGGSVSVTAGTPNIVVTPSPGTGTFTIGTTNALNTQANSTYTVNSTTDPSKEILRTYAGGAMTDSVPPATGAFGAGAGFALQTYTEPDTITPTTSTANGLAVEKLGARQYTLWLSDGTNWNVLLGVPQPATQTGNTYLRDDMTWQSISGSGTVTTTGSPASGNLAKFSGSTAITNGDLSGDATTSGTLAVTVTKTNGTAFGALATTVPGTGVATAAGNALSAAGGITTTIASGTAALGTSAIPSGTCATVVTTSAAGVATTDVIGFGFNGDPTGVVGYQPTTNGMLTIIAYPTSGNTNFKVCNNTSASVTPGAITLNWRVTR